MGHRKFLVVGAIAVVLAASVAGCGHDGSAALGDGGVLKPYRPNGVTLGNVVSLPVRPGTAETFDVMVVNRSEHRLTVTDAKVIPVPGHPAPTLLHTGLEHGKNVVGVQAQWPPAEVAVTDLINADLPPGRSTLAVAVTGRDVGKTYATAGLLLSFKDGDTASEGGGLGRGGDLCR